MSVRDPATAELVLVRQVRADLDLGLEPADAAVLCRSNAEAVAAARALRAAAVEVLDLRDYDGTPRAAVKVGTVKRAKGLEFGRVYLPRVDAYLLTDGQAEQERVQRERRELFVAMTRARDGLWLCRVDPAGEGPGGRAGSPGAG